MMKRFDTLVPGDVLTRSEFTVATAPKFVMHALVGEGVTLPLWECMVTAESGECVPFASDPARMVEVSHNVGIQETLF